jgi:ubiquinone/menaquinone biosynthesis C-methylase UbiE/ferredoxin
MNRQSVDSKKGEILFRYKLYQQHVNGKSVFEDEFNKDEILEIMKARVEKSEIEFEKMGQKGIVFSPFLEIGAERCQRSMLLTNNFNAEGFAVDISLDSLKSAQYFAQVLGFKKLPVRVCCDAYNLPFRNNSFPFCFCYETLHHFPDPSPIIQEIWRVLDTGYFFFAEEPIRRSLKINLYRKNRKIYSMEEKGKSKFIKIVESFISNSSCNEEEYGIVENCNISIANWKRILGNFDRDIILSDPLGIISCNLDSPKISLKRVLVSLLGGNIRGLCYAKKKDVGVQATEKIFDLIGCPNCLEVTQECTAAKCKLECFNNCRNGAIEIKDGRAILNNDKCNLCNECLYTCPLRVIDKPRLVRRDSKFACENCGKIFTTINGVLMLFSENQEKELYPEFLI